MFCEYFSSSRCAGTYSHIENADDAKSTGVPLLLVVLQRRVHGVQKLANDWDCPWRSRKVAFLIPINTLLKGEERHDDRQRSVQPNLRRFHIACEQ